MDFTACVAAATSLATVCIYKSEVPLVVALRISLSAFVLLYATLKVYRLFVYPIWLSPLRDLPGPKVRTYH
jgi:hypothetical protein